MDFVTVVTAFPVHSLEMLDKTEPPSIPDGYGISVAYACLLDIIRSIALTIEGASPSGNEQPETMLYRGSEEDRELHSQLINSSWCGLLAALSPLIDARYNILISKIFPNSIVSLLLFVQNQHVNSGDPCESITNYSAYMFFILII